MNIIDRIDQLRVHLKLNQKGFCERIQYPPSAYTNAKRRGSSIESNTLKRICDEFPEVSAEWLITGRGEMLKGNQAEAVEDSAAYRELERKYIRCLEEKDSLKKINPATVVPVGGKKKLK